MTHGLAWRLAQAEPALFAAAAMIIVIVLVAVFQTWRRGP